jgi:hypothetical protein
VARERCGEQRSQRLAVRCEQPQLLLDRAGEAVRERRRLAVPRGLLELVGEREVERELEFGLGGVVAGG